MSVLIILGSSSSFWHITQHRSCTGSARRQLARLGPTSQTECCRHRRPVLKSSACRKLCRRCPKTRATGESGNEEGAPAEAAEAHSSIDGGDGSGDSSTSSGDSSASESFNPQTLDPKSIEAMGMESWELSRVASEIVQVFVANIEGSWRNLVDDLAIHPTKTEYLYLDSLAPNDGSESREDLEDPAKGKPGYPRLRIENRCYQSRVFRKLHMEVAIRQDGLEVVHCVMYPRTEYALPILSMDVVAKDGVASLGIIDPCPVSMTNQLPQDYSDMVSEVQSICKVESSRAVPDWGNEIFSERCILMRPNTHKSLDAFYRYAVALIRVHLKYANLLQPVQKDRASRMRVIQAAHRRYSEHHLKNRKTQRVLAMSFGETFADEYMSNVMFDLEPTGSSMSTGATEV